MRFGYIRRSRASPGVGPCRRGERRQAIGVPLNDEAMTVLNEEKDKQIQTNATLLTQCGGGHFRHPRVGPVLRVLTRPVRELLAWCLTLTVRVRGVAVGIARGRNPGVTPRLSR